MAGNDGDAIKSLLPYVSNYYIGTSVQGYLDENGDAQIDTAALISNVFDNCEIVDSSISISRIIHYAPGPNPKRRTERGDFILGGKENEIEGKI